MPWEYYNTNNNWEWRKPVGGFGEELLQEIVEESVCKKINDNKSSSCDD